MLTLQLPFWVPMPRRKRDALLRVLLFASVGAHFFLWRSSAVTSQSSSAPAELYYGTNASEGAGYAAAGPFKEQAVPARTGAVETKTTVMREHAHGWTLFEDVYMANGTMFVVSDEPRDAFPPLEAITSTGLAAQNSPESVQERLPTEKDMMFISREEAQRRWGLEGRVKTVEGSTILYNDPSQFLDHYYHFCAELLLGTWTFWSGAFPGADMSDSANHPTRAIFAHAHGTPTEYGGGGWRDKSGFNALFLRAVFPALTVEVDEDWKDRVRMTSDGSHAWHFPTLLLVDRSAAFKAPYVGGTTSRTAAPPFYLFARRQLITRGFWEPVRAAVLAAIAPRAFPLASTLALSDAPAPFHPSDPQLQPGLEASAVILKADHKWDVANFARERVAARFRGEARERWAGAAATQTKAGKLAPGGLRRRTQEADGEQDAQGQGEVVVTYVSRQKAGRRKLKEEDHKNLVKALEVVCESRGWELVVAHMEEMTREEQLLLAARTTVMLGVHGNGMTHEIMMPQTKRSTVIEIFQPDSFAHDYEWTARALGHAHYMVWNDAVMTWPDTPWVKYGDEFHGHSIPVHPPAIAKLIESRMDGF